jgi:predicted O-linked N-acetylglucosamine transferase (SPINDLY family)
VGEWIAADADAYVALAQKLASDRNALSALRRDLRGRVLDSRLCDAPRFARDIEAAYESMWQRRQQGV